EFQIQELLFNRLGHLEGHEGKHREEISERKRPTKKKRNATGTNKRKTRVFKGGGVVIKLIKDIFRKATCRHYFILLPERRTILTTNGKLATHKIKVCTHCGKTKTTVTPR